MGKRKCLQYIVVMMIFLTSCSEQIPLDKTDKKETNLQTESQPLPVKVKFNKEVDISSITGIKLPEKIESVNEIFTKENDILKFNTAIDNGISKITGKKHPDGMKEMVYAGYNKNTSIDVAVYHYYTFQQALKIFNFEIKSCNSKFINNRGEEKNRYFEYYVNEKNEAQTFAKLGFLKGNLVIIVCEFSLDKKSSDLDVVLNSLSNLLSEIVSSTY